MDPVTIVCPRFDRAPEYAGAWAIDANYAAQLVRIVGEMDMAAHMAASRDAGVDSTITYQAADDGSRIAIVRAHGLLMKQQSSLGASTSTIQLRRDIRQAATDPTVSSILLSIDSPGGTVNGTEALVRDIRDARKAKQVVGQVEDVGASAAYWLAAVTDKLYASNRTTQIGSIGTYRVVHDSSEAAAKEGVKVHVFATGPVKGAGTPGSPVTDHHAAEFQRNVDAMQSVFSADLMEHRRFSPDQLSAVATGATYLADEAKRLGLIDGIQSLDTTLSQLAGRTSGRPLTKPPGKGVPAMTFEQYCASRGIVAANLSPEQLAQNRADFDAATKAQTPPVATPVGSDGAAMTGNLKVFTDAQIRLAKIDEICQKHGSPIVEHGGTTQSVKVHALEKNWSLLEVEQACQLAEMRSGRPQFPGTPAGPVDRYQGGNGPNFNFPKAANPLAVEAALCLQGGISEQRCGRWFGQDVMNRAMAADVRGLSLGNLLYMTCAAAGVYARPGGVEDTIIMKAIRADRDILSPRWNAEKDRIFGPTGEVLAASGPTTLSLSGILSNVANKFALNAYEIQAAVWSSFCAIRTHNDFKTVTRYRLDSTGAIKKVAADGKVKHVGLSETGFTNQLDTYGGQITINRQMWINDDLGMFVQIPSFMGGQTKIRIEELFMVTVLANAGSFYGSGNGNLVTTSAGAMTSANGIAAITLAETKFSNQVDAGHKPILNPPDRMLLGTVNYVPARNIYEGRVKITGENATQVDSNEHAGKYTPYKSPFLNNTAIKDQDGGAISGQSDTIWFLFADPAVRASYGAAFLNGNQAPTIMSEAAEFGTLGLSWVIYHDFGIGQEDPNGSVMVAGA